jgi:hypothetical protein
MSIVLQSSSGGQITIQEPTTASNFTQNLPAATGTVMVSGNQPAFRVYLDSNQTVTSAVSTKVTLNSEIFDTASCFNNTGSTVGGIPAYAFLPNVAGYYQFNVTGGASASGGLSYNYIRLFKNGNADSIAIYGPYGSTSNYGALAALVYLNGTTDYVELYAQIDGGGTVVVTGGNTAVSTYMSGFLARAA